MHGNNFPLRLPSEALGVRRSDVFRRTARHFNCTECIESCVAAIFPMWVESSSQRLSNNLSP
jgi:hypothetical protein